MELKLNKNHENLQLIKKEFSELKYTKNGRNRILKSIDAFAELTKFSYNYTKSQIKDEDKPYFMELIQFYIFILDYIKSVRHPISKKVTRAYIFFKNIQRRGI